MTVHSISVPMMKLVNLLMFDPIEAEWRVGHLREVLPGVEPCHCACTVTEANDMLMDDQPVPVFTEVSHWARLPANPNDVAVWARDLTVDLQAAPAG